MERPSWPAPLATPTLRSVAHAGVWIVLASLPPLNLTSLQAPHADGFCRALSEYLAQALCRAVRFVDVEPWQARERLLDAGQIELAWICGLPYTRRREVADPGVGLLVAPVMALPRYEDRPIYFSDVVVRRESPWRAFSDLGGTRWAYNEPSSHSGYCLTCFELARMGLHSSFFASVVEAGSHEAALELLLEGRIDATGLDSTVLDAMIERRPELVEELRVIATWGPSAIPPWVVSTRVDEPTRLRLLEILSSMHLDPVGRAILADAQTARFSPVEDADYDSIRAMARAAKDVTL